jgi:hypothetical protein
MRNLIIMISLTTTLLAILALDVYSDDEVKSPAIIGGKIWGGLDTLDVTKKYVPDSTFSPSDDTAKAEKPAEEIDWDSDDVIELPAENISLKTDMLKLKLSLPPTLKFIKDAPVKLLASSGNREIAEIGEGKGNDPGKGFAFSLSVNPGETDLYLYYRVVCCTKGSDMVCFFKEAKLKIPVTIGDFEESAFVIRHDIEN